MKNFGKDAARVINNRHPECPFPCFACERSLRTLSNCGRMRERWPHLLRLSELPPAYWDALSLLSTPPKGLEESYLLVMRYIEQVKTHAERGNGLLFQGDPGTSKTTLAAAVGMSYLLATREAMLTDAFSDGAANLSSPLFYISALEISNRLLRSERSERDQFERRLQDCRLLLLDDLGFEIAYDGGGAASSGNFVTVFIQSLIEHRHKMLRATLVTTNLTNSQLKAIYNQGTIQRLAERNHPILLEGASLRQRFRLT